jgi:hypothetical protein
MEVTPTSPVNEVENLRRELAAARKRVSELEQIEEKLKRRETQLTEVQEMVHLGIWSWDIVRNIVTWSAELCRIYGLEMDSFPATFEGYLERVHPDDQERVKGIILRSVETAEPFSFEERIVRPDGTERVLESVGKVVANEQGQSVQLVGSCLDITERKLAEKQLKEQATKLLALYQNSRDIISILDLDLLLHMIVQRAAQVVKADRGLILLVNVQARELEKMVWYGYEDEDLADLEFQEVEDGISGWVLAHGRPVISEDMVADARNTGLAFNRASQENPTGRSIIVAPLMVRDDVIGTLTTISEEGNKIFDRADLELVLLLANQAAIAIENARLFQASKAYTAVLEQRVSERTAELTVALKEAQEADKLKSSFISDINHELRTPLNNLGLYLSFIERGSPKKRSEYLNIVRRETERLQWLISQLLDFSRLDAGTLAANLELVDLNQLAGTLVNDRKQLAQDKNLTLAFAAAPELPPALADPKLLFQVLTNLLSNAINYTFPGGKIIVHSGLQERDGRTWVTVSVKDNGLGISDEDQEQLFERFYRGVAAEITKASGAGLGLSICKEIMDQHGGKITVKSQLGQGSSFTLWLQPA